MKTIPFITLLSIISLPAHGIVCPIKNSVTNIQANSAIRLAFLRNISIKKQPAPKDMTKNEIIKKKQQLKTAIYQQINTPPKLQLTLIRCSLTAGLLEIITKDISPSTGATLIAGSYLIYREIQRYNSAERVKNWINEINKLESTTVNTKQ